jgi:glyoxalase family protein
MTARTPGIHHVTAIAGDPQRNIDFYTDTLGLRLVKLTVNFDDPSAYHLYYGDDLGRPGSIMTFFTWPGANRGRQGVGQAGVTSFAVPRSSLAFWVERLVQHRVRHDNPTSRFGEQVLSFKDPDGLLLEIVASEGTGTLPRRETGPVPGEHAIRGFHSVTLWEHELGPTAKLLTETMGFQRIGEEEHITRYRTDGDAGGAVIDVRTPTGFWSGSVAVGTVHHVAWRTPSDELQLEARTELTDLGLQVTSVLDRQYFHSIYFREPGGVLFEIATDPPGFTADEPAEALGAHLKLPPWLEPRRESIEAGLPHVHLPGVERALSMETTQLLR